MPEHRIYLTAEDSGAEIDLAGPAPIVWRFTTGGAPSTTDLRLYDHIDKQVKAEDWENNTWKLTFDSGSGSPRVISGIHMVARMGNSGPDAGAWGMADWRISLAGCTVDTMFNEIRAQNSRRRPGTPTDPNLALFTQVPVNAFILHTLQDQFSDQPRPASGESDAVKPWTALEALKYLVTNEGWLKDYNTNAAGVDNGNPLLGFDGQIFEFGKLIVSDLVTDNKILVKKFNPRANWGSAVNMLARKARVMVFSGPNREVIIQSADPKHANDILKKYGKYEGAGGIPTLATLQSRAPRSLTFRFPQFQEIRWDFDERLFLEQYGFAARSGLPQKEKSRSVVGGIVNRAVWQKTPNRNIFALENVLRLPQDTDNFQKGTWVPIPVALDEWKRDTKNLPKPKGKLTSDQIFTYHTILKYIQSTGLANVFQRDYTRLGFRNPILEARVASIYQSFRRIYRIPEVWLDHIETWKPQIASIFSESARARQPSPVYMDSYAWDTHLNVVPSTSFTRPDRAGQGYIRNYPIGGKSDLPQLEGNFAALGSQLPHIFLPPALKRSYDYNLDDLEPSMFAVSVLDAKQGVFQVVSPPDLSGQTQLHLPGLYDPATVPDRNVASLNARGLPLIGKMRTMFGHRLATVLSVRWRSPNTLARHFSIKFNGEDFLAGAAGGHKDVFYSGFPAFKSWKDGAVAWNESSNGHLSIEHNGPVENEEILREVAVGETNEIYFQYQPRVIGVFRASPGNTVLPVGHIGSTEVRFRQGVYESVAVATNPPKSPAAWEFFSPYTKDVIARLEQGSNDLLEP